MKLIVPALACALSFATQIAWAQAPITIPAPTANGEAAGFDTSLSVDKNPLKCATQDNLVFLTTTGFPRVEFFSCDPEKVPVELSAIIDYGRKSPVSLEKFGFAPSKAEAERLHQVFSNDKFLSPEDKTGRQYLAALKEGLRKKGVSYINPPKK